MRREQKGSALRQGMMLGLAMLGLCCLPVRGDRPPARATAPAATVNPAKLPLAGTVSRRFQSYNIEMVEVTGGRFWRPYKDVHKAAGGAQSRYEYRPPIDLSNPRLRKLAAALGPAYVRVSGTWANSTWFDDARGPAPKQPPAGFKSVLTRQEWKGVVDFAKAVHAQIITSFAISPGTRNAEGVWTPRQARELLNYTKSLHGTIAAVEFMNEPDFAVIGGAPKGYDAAAYGRDVKVFRPFLRRALPGALFLGPGSAVEGGPLAIALERSKLTTPLLMQATGPVYDAFSYHIYTAASQRCAPPHTPFGTSAGAALSQEWLSRFDKVNGFYTHMRDQVEPGKPLWVTETADAACGGNPWAATFLDTFRYLIQHGGLARQGVQVLAHNTLSASDYGLLDENTYEPRPNYWASLLWRRFMGRRVLKVASEPARGLYLYAQCLPGAPGGVTLLAINTSRSAPLTIDVAAAGERYTMTAKRLESTQVELNGRALKLGADDALPELKGEATKAGEVKLPLASITFLAMKGAGNEVCR